ncbi:metal ABC transporter permease [Ammoniphilus sp. YIM 78166]|uniref:metal ABC transporter permease n=1 Tax=Ammoniphilus sp. YIM 78166 TaxID=1644106 RepID=UPI00106F76F9|nr:metal ABC transporter permease [Ammoniphilus sp. YIM 78166]
MSHSAWIILIGSLVASSCGLVGCFLILRRMAMLGDAISHAILPGIVLAFLISHSMDGIVMLIGATIVGLLTAFFIQTLHGSGVQSDAAIGVTFTALFSLGVVLVSLYTSRVHLDLQHVLYGEIAYAPWELVTFIGIELPKAVWMMGGVFVLTLTVVGLLYKEIKLTSFDPQLATALGIPVVWIHYTLMGLVSMNTVAAFESVGAILVVAMLVIPGATAYLLTERLSRMLLLSLLFGVTSAVGGYLLAVFWDVSISGSMTTFALLQFVLGFLFAPRQGLLSRWVSYKMLQRSHTTER